MRSVIDSLNTLSLLTLSLLTLLSALHFSGCTEQPEDLMSNREVGINSIREPFHKSDESCGPYPNYYLEYLDDTRCRKRLPSNRDRDFICPVISSAEDSRSLEGYTRASRDGAEISFDQSLAALFPAEASVTVILIKRVDGVPYYRYLSNGRHDEVVQTWSSSKFLGILNASESIRYHSEGAIGLDALIGDVPLGDLVSIVHSYDEREYTSNGLMYWFHDVGGRSFANQLIHDRWLNRPEEEIFGANYGAKAPPLGFTFNNQNELTVDVPQDQGWIKTNLLSTHTLAEALKRLVMYREDPTTRLEYSTWDDIKVLLYGSESSKRYDQQTPQGMESDPSVYAQEAVNISMIDDNTQGQWRIFSKLGLGFSRGGEIVHTDYACLPVFNEEGETIVDQGLELVISVHFPTQEDYAGKDQQLAELYKALFQGLLSKQIQ